MESLAIELVRSLGQQGPAYTLLAIVGIALVIVTRFWVQAKNECFSLSETLNEKRLTEQSRTIQVLHEAAQANRELAGSISVRTETLNNLITVVTVGNERLERQWSDGLRELKEVLRGGRRAGLG